MRLLRKFAAPALLTAFVCSQATATDFTTPKTEEERILIPADPESMLEAYIQTYGHEKGLSLPEVGQFLVCMINELDFKEEIYQSCGVAVVALVKGCKFGGTAICIGASVNAFRECQQPAVKVLQAVNACKLAEVEEEELPLEEEEQVEEGEQETIEETVDETDSKEESDESEVLLDESEATSETLPMPF